MCGDVEGQGEEGGGLRAGLQQRFQAQARALLARQPASGGKGGDKPLNAYLDSLFAETLQHCIADLEGQSPADAYQRMAMQSLVLARLAGFMAGHVALAEDPLRKRIEALMMGYGEAEMAPAHDHHHGHHHHDHDHDHGHTH